MNFLKCNNCGHFNEVKTQYLTFCSKCNKKLENNFTYWSMHNPDKSFEDYKQLICTTNKSETIQGKSKTNNPKGLKYIIGFTVTMAIFTAIGKLGGEQLVAMFRKPAFNKVMMESANEINKVCPVMVDNGTRLDNAIALPNNVFQYNYTLVDLVKDSINIDGLKNYLEPTIINTVKTNPEMKVVRENKTTVNYYYKDKVGVYLFTISVTPEQYQ